MTAGRRLGAVMLFVGLAASLAACSSARTDVGTTDESCFKAIPTASHAVEDRGHLAGVRKYSLADLHGLAPRLADRLADQMPKGQAVCLVAYSGRFDSSRVSKPLGRGSGPLAVAVVTWPGDTLLGTLILDRIPVRFGHSHPF